MKALMKLRKSKTSHRIFHGGHSGPAALLSLSLIFPLCVVSI